MDGRRRPRQRAHQSVDWRLTADVVRSERKREREREKRNGAFSAFDGERKRVPRNAASGGRFVPNSRDSHTASNATEIDCGRHFPPKKSPTLI